MNVTKYWTQTEEQTLCVDAKIEWQEKNITEDKGFHSQCNVN